MNNKLTIVLLAIFGLWYFGYPAYQDKKIAEQIRTELKKPLNQSEFMGAVPPEIAAQLNASMDNQYPILNFNLRFKQMQKSDFSQDVVKEMKAGFFFGACEGFYKCQSAQRICSQNVGKNY